MNYQSSGIVFDNCGTLFYKLSNHFLKSKGLTTKLSIVKKSVASKLSLLDFGKINYKTMEFSLLLVVWKTQKLTFII